MSGRADDGQPGDGGQAGPGGQPGDETSPGGQPGDGARPGDETRTGDEPRDGTAVVDQSPDATAAPGPSPERRATFYFGLSALASIGLAVVYAKGGQAQLEGILLALISGGIGLGIVVWAKHYMPAEEVAQDRGRLSSTEEEVAAFRADFEAGEEALKGRRMLLRTAGVALAAFGAALLFPIRSLGPRPGKDLKRTAYEGGGLRVVGEDGEPVRPGELAAGGVLTVWPEGHTDAADAPTLLIRPLTGQELDLPGDRRNWVAEGIVAYSKLCTHTGCPVGLYQAQEGLLLCPCHQSTFDVLDGARPIFGPAARPLPQLPLDVDDDGYIVATGDFSEPVGGGFWDRGR